MTIFWDPQELGCLLEFVGANLSHDITLPQIVSHRVAFFRYICKLRKSYAKNRKEAKEKNKIINKIKI
jgi:small basic protein